MGAFVRRAAGWLQRIFELVWHYMGSMAAVCMFAAVLGLGIYHAVVQDAAPRYFCYAGLYNPAGAEPPAGLVPMGAEAEPGIPHVRLEYDAAGRLARVKSVNAQGRVCSLPGSKVAEQRLYYDNQGYLMRRENRDVRGALAEDAQGVAVREFEHDAAGRSTRILYRDAGRNLTVPRFPGYAESRMYYDAAGRPLSVEYLDAEGKPIVNAAGEQRVVYEYADDGNLVIRRNMVNGVLADNRNGVAKECYREFPNGTSRQWLNAEGAPAEQPFTGAAALHCDLHPDMGMQRRRYVGADGKPCAVARICTEHLLRCNQHGWPEWECFSGSDGLPVDNARLGYAERVCEYGEDGGLEREFRWDAAGNPAKVAERRYVRLPQGEYALSVYSDGSTSLQPE